MAIKRCCDTCIFAKVQPNHGLVCKRFPPTLVEIPTQDAESYRPTYYASTFPPVDKNEWCGEFKFVY